MSIHDTKRQLIIGVMGGGKASAEAIKNAYRLGKLIAENGWILLNGGRNAGIMDASAKGAKDGGGLTIGILPDADTHRVSRYIDIPILTGMGNARNCINVLSSDIVVACNGKMGTLSEIALALKSEKHVILLDFDQFPVFTDYINKTVHYANSAQHAIAIIKTRIYVQRS